MSKESKSQQSQKPVRGRSVTLRDLPREQPEVLTDTEAEKTTGGRDWLLTVPGIEGDNWPEKNRRP
jgi:hypothetical protein